MLQRLLELGARRRRRPGAHPAWIAVTFAAFLLRQYKQRAQRQEIVVREELRPGEALLISHLPDPQG
ncbi:MAG: hypothetical protein WD691_01860 [Acidimicrobiales bacterium]